MAPKKPAAKLPKPVKAWGIVMHDNDDELLEDVYLKRVAALAASKHWGRCSVIRVEIRPIPPKPRKVK